MSYRDAQGERSGYRRRDDVMTNSEMIEKIVFLIVLALTAYTLISMFVILHAMTSDSSFIPFWAKPVAKLLSAVM